MTNHVVQVLPGAGGVGEGEVAPAGHAPRRYRLVAAGHPGQGVVLELVVSHGSDHRGHVSHLNSEVIGKQSAIIL